MRKSPFPVLTLTLIWLTTTAVAQTDLPTLDEALEISQSTGLPILAMAGRET
ncbi:MAG: hypothetical protein ACR2NP_05785 [Pirellulaceae bacterium]